jgi:hypothetical protein
MKFVCTLIEFIDTATETQHKLKPRHHSTLASVGVYIYMDLL